MSEEAIMVDNKLFLGRVEEQKQFRAALAELLSSSDRDELPYIFLLYGDGGMGKTTLAKRFRDIAMLEAPYKGSFQTLWIDWEDERKKSPALQVGRDYVTTESVFRALYSNALRNKWGRKFPAYRQALDQGKEAERKVAEVLTGDDGWDELAILRSVSVDLVAKIIRSRFPIIGFAGEQLVELFLDAGVQVGVEQATKLRASLENYLRARLEDDYFEHFYNPDEQLAHALARGLYNASRQKRLIVFLDAYELVDRADIWMRAVMRAAGSRVVWVISDRNDLVHSRQFGYEYFKGYADDFPHRLIGYNMRPLALDYIRAYFDAHNIQLSDSELETISRVTRGIPLAVHAAVEMLDAGASLDSVVSSQNSVSSTDHPTSDSPLLTTDEIVRLMTDRYLQHAVAESDREALYALALADGDVDILRAMLRREDGTEVDVAGLLQRLERDYASVHAERARLHDDPAHFIREYLRNDVRRTGPFVRSLNEKAVYRLREQLEELEAELPLLEERCQNEAWAGVALALAGYLIWLDENEMWRWLLPRFVEGLGYNQALSSGLLQQIVEWQEALSEGGRNLYQRLQAVQNDYPSIADEAAMLHVLGKMEERGWLAGEGSQERQAILSLKRGLLYARRQEYKNALSLFERVEKSLPATGHLLRDQLGAALEGVARRLIWPAGARSPRYAPEAIALLEKVVSWLPNKHSAWHYLGLVHELGGQYQKALGIYQRALELESEESKESRAATYHSMGNVYSALGLQEQAQAAYQRAIELDKKLAAPHISLGDIYRQQGSHERAEAAYQQAIESDSRAAAPHRGLAAIYLSKGRYQEALDEYQKALALSPNHAASHVGLGDALFQMARLDEAQVAYERAIGDKERGRDRDLSDASPSPISISAAYTGLGNVHRSRQAWPEALAAYQQAVRLNTEAAAAYYGLGKSYHALGNSDKAISALQRAMALDPALTAPASMALGDLYRDLGRSEEALAAYEKVQTLGAAPRGVEGVDLQTSISLAQTYQRLGRHEEAVAAYQQVLALDPTNTTALAGLADEQVVLGRPEEAVESYQKALAQAPDLAVAHLGIGHAHLQLGQYDEAVTAFERAIELQQGEEGKRIIASPGRPHTSSLTSAYWGLGEAQRQSGRYDAARLAYEQARVFAPNDPRPFSGLGQLAIALDRAQEAHSAFMAAIERGAEDAMSHAGLAQAQARLGQSEAAIVSFQQAIALDPAYAPAYAELGDLYHERGLLADALSAYQQVLELDPDFALSYANLGDAYAAARMWDKAQETFRQAIRQAPDSPQVYAGLGRVHLARCRPEEALAAFRKVIELEGMGSREYSSGGLRPGIGTESALLPTPHSLLPSAYVGMGDALLDLHRVEEAIAAYQYVQTLEHDNPQAFAGLGDAYAVQGDYGAAASSYRKALELDPTLVRAALGMGDVYLQRKRWNDAAAAYHRALQLDPGDPAARTRLGDLARHQEKLDEAQSAYEKAIELDPAYAQAHIGMGMVMQARGEYEMARSAYQTALRSFDGRDFPYARLGEVYEALGQHDRALAAYEKAAEAGADATTHVRLGGAYADLGRDEAALEQYRQAIARDPEDAEAYYGLGMISARMGDLDGAHAAIQEALELDPRQPRYYIALGDLYRRQGAMERAEMPYQQALELDLRAAEAHYGLGCVYLQQEHLDDAVLAFKRAIEIEGVGSREYSSRGLRPGIGTESSLLPAAYSGLGVAYAALGETTRAREAFERAIELDPAHSESHYGLGNLYASVGQADEALDAYERAATAYGTVRSHWRAAAQVGRGDVLATLGRLEEARAAYESVLSLIPSGSDPSVPRVSDVETLSAAHSGLGRLYRQQGELEMALEAYQKAIELNPTHQAAYEALGDLHLAEARAEEALAAYRAALDADSPTDPRAAGLLGKVGDAYRALGRLNEALTSYHRALGLDPDHLSSLEGLGATYFQQRNFQEARNAYRRAVALDPRRATAYVGLGRALLASDNDAEAAGALELAIELDSANPTAHLCLAELHAGNGAYEKALAAYQNVLSLGTSGLDPSVARDSNVATLASAYQGMGAVYERQGKMQEALAAYEQAIELDPKLVASWQGMGRIKAAVNEPNAAIFCYREAIKLDGAESQSYIELGRLHMQLEQYEQARDAFLNAQALEPSNLETLIALGNAYTALAQYDVAIAAYQEVLARDPEAAEIGVGLGELYRRLGRSQEALEAYQACGANYPPAQVGIGFLYLEANRPHDAIATFQNALHGLEASSQEGQDRTTETQTAQRGTLPTQKAPLRSRPVASASRWFPRALIGLGDAYRQLAHYERAELAYRRAIEMDAAPACGTVRSHLRVAAYYGLGQVLYHLGLYDDALVAYQQALEAEDNASNREMPVAAIEHGLGQVYDRMGKHNMAISAYKKALRLDPDYLDAYASLGAIYNEHELYENAVTIFERALEMEGIGNREESGPTPHSLLPLFTGLGRAYTALGRLEEALQIYQKAIELDPRRAETRCGLGEVFRLMGQNAQAIAAYDRAIRLDRKYAAPHVGLGRIYQQIQPYDALAAFERALRLDKEDADAYTGIGDVYTALHRPEPAMEAYQKAIELAPNLARAHQGLGDLYTNLGRHEEARDSYIRAIELNPREATVYGSLGDVYTRLGDTERAIMSYERAVERNPRDACSRGSLAGLYLKAGRQAEYEEQIQAARELVDNQNAYNRACLAAISGQVDEALSLLQTALDLRQVQPDWMLQDPDLDFIRQDPRFTELVSATGA